MTQEDPKKIHTHNTAINRGVVVTGDMTGNTVVTGDLNQVHTQTAITREDFFKALSELRQELATAELEKDIAADLQQEAAAAEELARREKPNRSLLVGKLKTILDVLGSAASTGDKLVPVARQLVEWGGQLF